MPLKRSARSSGIENDGSGPGIKRSKTSGPGPETELSDLPDTEHRLLSLIDRAGGLFSCPSPALFIHSCNCLGHWGKGVAALFKEKYPNHYVECASHCRRFKAHPEELLGTALLIPPQPVKSSNANRSTRAVKHVSNPDFHRGNHDWIACLFTRVKPGMSRAKSQGVKRQAEIETLDATAKAMRDMLRQVAEVEASGRMAGTVSWAMPRINAGLFGVDWKKTEGVLSNLSSDAAHQDDDGGGGVVGADEKSPRIDFCKVREIFVYSPA